jgi:hypothetical protein
MDLSLDARTEEAAKELIERLDKRRLAWSENTAIVGVFEKEDSKPKFSSTQVCHAGLNDIRGSKRVVNALMSGQGYATGRVLGKDVELWFVDYILNRSPYAETFITKDAAKALEQKYTVSSGDHPANLMAAGMVALRRLWEYTYVAKAAFDLAQQGVNEDLAFLLGHLIASSDNPGPQSAASWDGFAAGHCSINPGHMDWKACKNFLEHKITKPNGLFSAGDRYDGYDSMFCEGPRGRYVQAGDTYYNFVKREFPYDLCKAKAAVNLNPFVKAMAAGAAEKSKYGKLIEVMGEWAKTTLMEKINNA